MRWCLWTVSEVWVTRGKYSVNHRGSLMITSSCFFHYSSVAWVCTSVWLVSCDPQDTLSSHSVLHSLLPLQEAQNSEKSTHCKRWSKGGTAWCQKTEDLDSSSPHLSLTHAVSWKQGGTTVQNTASGVPRNWVWILALPLSVCESLTALSLSFLICRMRIKIPTFYSKIYVKCFTWYLAHS